MVTLFSISHNTGNLSCRRPAILIVAHHRSAAFRQIGNAVPPLMAERIGEKIKEMLDNEH